VGLPLATRWRFSDKLVAMAVHTLRVRRLGIDTHQEAVVYMRRFAAEARVALAHGVRAHPDIVVLEGPA